MAHVIATLDVGGAEKQLLTLCREQIRHGYTVAVIPLKGSNSLASQFSSIGVEVYGQLIGKKAWEQWVRLLMLTRVRQSFIFHAHSPKAQLLLSLLPLGPRYGLVMSKHDAMRFIPRFPPWVSKLAWRLTQARASQIILISNAIQAEMDSFNESIDTKKTTVIHYGISIEERNEIKQSNRYRIRGKWKIPEKAFVIGTVGRLVKEKNHLFLLEVFVDFFKLFPDSYLVICGYGPLEKELLEKVKDFNLGGNVLIDPKVNNTKEVYVGFDLFVLPSVTEGFGLVLLEAMCAELPIIGSKAGAIPEVLGQDYEFMFNPTNRGELFDLLVKAQDSKVRDEKVIYIRANLPHFSSESMFMRMETVYSSL